MNCRGLYFEDFSAGRKYATDRRTITEADRGIVSFFQRVNNQDEEPVMEYTIRRMIRRKHV